MKVNERWGTLTPATQKPLNRWSPKFVYLTTSGISTTTQNFNQIGLGVSVLRMRDFAPLGRKWLGYFFCVLEKGYSRDARTDFDAKYVKRRGSAQGTAFWGSRNQNLIFPKTAIFGPHFKGTEFFRPKTALKGHFTHIKLFFKITEIETLINITYIVRFLRSTDVSVFYY